MSPSKATNARWLGILVAMVPSAGSTALQAQPGPDPADGLRSDNSHPSVYLHDSFAAEELIAKVVRQASGGLWLEASRSVRRAMAQHHDKLTRVAPGAYVGLASRLNRLVASWPPEGLAAYRALGEPEARRRLAAARSTRSVEALLVTAERYFCTRAGAEAAELAAELALEAGDFNGAAAIYRRLLDEHPDGPSFRAKITARLAIVHALWGRGDTARTLAGQAGADATIEWMNQRQPLAPLVRSLLSNVHPRPGPATPAEWPSFGGNDQRNAHSDLPPDRLAVLWEATGIGDAAGRSGDESGDYRRAVRRGRLLSVNPVLSGGTLFLQDRHSIWALNAANGNVIWRHVVAGKEAGVSYSSDSELAQWHAVTISGSRVYACVGSEVTPYYGYEAPASSSALICLDATCGDELWRADRASLGANAGELAFESTPIVADDRLYVVARRKRAFGFEDCFLYRLNALTGEVQFRTHLGSASTGGFGYRRPTLTVPSRYEDIVYVVTNLGTVGAVDRHTGSVRWLRLYERISEAQWRREGRGASRTLSPWQYNPVICTAESLYALPTDSESLLVLDRASGRVRQEVPLSELALIQTLLGVDEPRIYGVGDAAFCYDLAAGTHLWQTPLPEDGEVMGRGLLTSDRLLVPTRSALCAFDRQTGAATGQSWAAPTGGGNLLAAGDQLFVAASDRVMVYARKGDVLERLRELARRNSSDPTPALDLAEVLFRTGETAEALDALDQAIARAGSFARAIEAGIKRRLFDVCLRFADQLAESAEPNPDTIMSLYERASQCPPDTRAHLTYRFRWARRLENAGRWGEAVGLYQQVLADRSLAGTQYAEDPERPGLAGLLAESAIGRLIDEHGREVYARFDAQAAQWLAAARTSGDTALLDRLLESLPNSGTAPDALLLRAELLIQRGKPLEASRSLAVALTAYRSQVGPPAVMKRIADCYREAGRSEVAWRWLTRAARQYPTATLRIDGRSVGLLDYRGRLGDLRAQVEASRPRLAPPLDGTYQRDFEAPCYLLDPRFADLPQAQWGNYLVYSGGAVQCFVARTNEPAWPELVSCPTKPDLLLAAGGRVVLANQHRVFGLDADSGRLVWDLGQRPAALDEPDADPEDYAAFVSFAVTDGLLVALRADGSGAAVAIDSGRRVWQRLLEDRPAGPIAMNRTWIVYQAARLGWPVFGVLSTADGQPAGTIDPQNNRQVTRILLTPDDRLLLVTTETVQCYDPADGQQVWQVRRDDGVMAGGVALDLDGLFLADSNLRIEKLSLTRGRRMWRTDSPDPRLWPGADGITFHPLGGQLWVVTERRVMSLAQRDGRLLWDGMVRRGTRFRHHFFTDSFLVAVDSPPDQFDEPRTAHFFELGSADGLLPAEGRVQKLGAFEDVKRISVRDGALLLQTGQTIHAWTSAARHVGP